MKKNFFAGITMLALFALLICAPPPTQAAFNKKAIGIEKAVTTQAEFYFDTSPGVILNNDAGTVKSPNEALDNDAGISSIVSISKVGGLKNEAVERYGTRAREKIGLSTYSVKNNLDKTYAITTTNLKKPVPSPDILKYGNLGKDAIPKQTEISISYTLGKGGINEVLLE